MLLLFVSEHSNKTVCSNGKTTMVLDRSSNDKFLHIRLTFIRTIFSLWSNTRIVFNEVPLVSRSIQSEFSYRVQSRITTQVHQSQSRIRSNPFNLNRQNPTVGNRSDPIN